MCKYCENLFTGNSSENLVHSDVIANGVYVASSVSFIGENDNDEPVICTTLMNNHGENVASDEIVISWCPVCGRSLKSCS
jgi:hypothetical protein